MVACVGRAKAACGRLVGADKLVSTFPLYIPALEKSFLFFAAAFTSQLPHKGAGPPSGLSNLFKGEE